MFYGGVGPELTRFLFEGLLVSNRSPCRYGGQLVLLADQDLLLVLSEKGVVTLIEAVPEKFTELAQMPAIEGKTWNHPVLVNDILLVRNTQEMVAYQMPLAGG